MAHRCFLSVRQLGEAAAERRIEEQRVVAEPFPPAPAGGRPGETRGGGGRPRGGRGGGPGPPRFWARWGGARWGGRRGRKAPPAPLPGARALKAPGAQKPDPDNRQHLVEP